MRRAYIYCTVENEGRLEEVEPKEISDPDFKPKVDNRTCAALADWAVSICEPIEYHANVRINKGSGHSNILFE